MVTRRRFLGATALGAAQSHVGMCQLYLRNLKLHQEIGCDSFCAFASIGKP